MTALKALPTLTSMPLDKMVYSLGIEPPEKFPHSFSDCFNFNDKTEAKNITPKLSGLSRTLKGLIPPELDGQFISGNILISQILDNEKIQKSSAFIAATDTIVKGIPLATAFLIIREHKDSENYPELMEMRKTIQAVGMVQKYAAKGSHKGEFASEMQTAITAAVASKNVVMLTQEQFFPFFELATLQMLEGNEKAKQCLLTYKENKK